MGRVAPLSDRHVLTALNHFSIHTPQRICQRVLLIEIIETIWAYFRAGLVKIFRSPHGFVCLFIRVGFILIVGLASAMVYGITTVQTYVYYMHYSDDASVIKFLVTAIWILDTIHFSFMGHILYYYLITSYGVPTSLEYIVWSIPASILVNVFVISIVQCFFLRQIYHLCRPGVKWLVTAPIILLMLAHLGLGIETVVMELANHEASILTQLTFSGVAPSLVVITLAEVLIMVLLCTLFYESGSGSVFPRTKRLLNTLIIYVVSRFLLIFLVTVADLVTVVIEQGTWSVGLSFILEKLYANSLLASLNSREYLRSQGAGTLSDLRIVDIYLANLPELPREIESSQGGARRFDVSETAVIDITIDPALLNRITTPRREEEL